MEQKILLSCTANNHAFLFCRLILFDFHHLDFGSAALIKSMMLQYVTIDNLISIMFQEEFQR